MGLHIAPLQPQPAAATQPMARMTLVTTILVSVFAVLVTFIAWFTQDQMLIGTIGLLLASAWMMVMLIGIPILFASLSTWVFHTIQGRTLSKEPDEDGHRALLSTIMMAAFAPAMLLIHALYTADWLLSNIVRPVLNVEIALMIATLITLVAILMLDMRWKITYTAK